MDNGCGASKESHTSQNIWQNEIPLSWRFIPGQPYPLMAATEQFWRCCVYKGDPRRVCGRLYWFLPSLPFFTVSPMLTLRPGWIINSMVADANEAGQIFGSCVRVTMEKMAMLLLLSEPLISTCKASTSPSTYWQKTHRWQRRERQMCKI